MKPPVKTVRLFCLALFLVFVSPFASATYQVDISAASANPMTGLWNNVNESGWGIVVTQEYSTMFVTIYTYDEAGNPVWYVASNCHVAGNGCGGATGAPLYKVTGGTPITSAWSGTNKAVTQVGTLILSFTDVNTGFAIVTINGVSNTKTVTRDVFANPAAYSPQTTFAIDKSSTVMSGLWNNANESGWGATVTHQYGMMFATVYTYDSSGNPIWYVASSCSVVGTSCSGSLYKVTGGTPITAAWNGNNKAVLQVGSVILSFTDANNGEMLVTVNNVSTTKGFVKSVFANTPAVNSVGRKPFATSYENKNSINLDNPTTPFINQIPNITLEAGEDPYVGRALAFADFLQNGSYSAIVVTGIYKNLYKGSNPNKWPDSPGKIYFLSKDSSANWTDVTSKLITNLSQRYICITPSFLEIGDLNNDGKPDVLISCTGIDFTVNGVWTNDQLSKQYIVLSQPDGTYQVQSLPISPIYGHQATIADIDDDGNADIITVDPVNNKTPFILWGNGDGTFRPDYTRFPGDMSGKNIYGIHAIPINGKLNVVVSGNTPGGSSASYSSDYGTEILQYINGSFQYTQDLTAGIPKVTSTGLKYGLALDVIYHSGNLITYFYDSTFTNYAIIQFNLSTGLGTILNENYEGPATIGDLLFLTSNNMIVNMFGGCGAYELNTPSSGLYKICNFSMPAH